MFFKGCLMAKQIREKENGEDGKCKAKEGKVNSKEI